mmetsp:Transcript_39630/g.88113  ORF Transcript_39630/g.88113 Transcript_39630/m.88113 type:complete len:162 (-) Transcript_39630:165-650(-)
MHSIRCLSSRISGYESKGVQGKRAFKPCVVRGSKPVGCTRSGPESAVAQTLASTIASITALQLALSGTSYAAAETPYSLQNKIQYGVMNGAVRACPSNINPNCVSTASTNDTYGPAWRAKPADVKVAAQQLQDTVLAVFEEQGVQLLTAQTVEAGEYLVFG